MYYDYKIFVIVVFELQTILVIIVPSELMKNGLTSLGARLGIISRPSPVRPTVEEEEDPLDALYKKTVVRSHI